MDENTSGTFTFDLYDPGVSDSFTMQVDWGDGQTQTLYPNQGVFTLNHTYADDNPTATPQDNYTITATVTDDDTGSFVASTTATVKNVAPTLTLEQSGPLYFGKNRMAYVSGGAADLGPQDVLTVAVNWGDGSSNDVYTLGTPGALTFAYNHTYPNDANPSNVYTISVTASDDDGGAVTRTLTAKEVGITGWTVERLDVNNAWVSVGDQDWASADDQFRWTATISPSEVSIQAVEWWAAPWADRNNPGAQWTKFAETSGSVPAITGGLGPGIWAVFPRAKFLDHNAFVQVTEDPPAREHREARIHDVTFLGVNAGDGQTNLSADNPGDTGEGYSMGGGWRFYYGQILLPVPYTTRCIYVSVSHRTRLTFQSIINSSTPMIRPTPMGRLTLMQTLRIM